MRLLSKEKMTWPRAAGDVQKCTDIKKLFVSVPLDKPNVRIRNGEAFWLLADCDFFFLYAVVVATLCLSGAICDLRCAATVFLTYCDVAPLFSPGRPMRSHTESAAA